MANMQSLKDYADVRLGAYTASQGTGWDSYSLGPDGIDVTLNIFGFQATMTLGTLSQIQALGDELDMLAGFMQTISARQTGRPAPPGSYGDYLECVAGQLAAVLGNGDQVETLIVLHVAIFAVPEIAGPVAAIYNANILFTIRNYCTQQVYGNKN